MITEDYVSDHTALLLKEKNFPQISDTHHFVLNGKNGYAYRPTLSLVKKWLIKEKNIHVVVLPNMDWDSSTETYINPHYIVQFHYFGKPYYGVMQYDRGFNDVVPYKFSKPEEALEAGINKALELI